jgi:hypothetical protein
MPDQSGVNPALLVKTPTATAFDPVKSVLSAQRLGKALQPQEDDNSLDRAARLAKAFRSDDDGLAFPKPITDE